MDEKKCVEYTKELKAMIPHEEYNAIMSQEYCELDFDFLGFVNVYKPLSELIPVERTVIDFGCYLAAQSYFFSNHKGYIGVDSCTLNRFTPPNAVHYVMSIQKFIAEVLPGLLKAHKENHYCAICSYVPDREATALVRKTFPNVFCYYPSSDDMR